MLGGMRGAAGRAGTRAPLALACESVRQQAVHMDSRLTLLACQLVWVQTASRLANNAEARLLADPQEGIPLFHGPESRAIREGASRWLEKSARSPGPPCSSCCRSSKERPKWPDGPEADRP